MSLGILKKNIDNAAFVAQEIERRLKEGIGTSSAVNTLNILRVCSEEAILTATLPYATESFAIVVAPLLLLWQPDFLTFFMEVRRILQENGALFFATLSAATLPTLEQLGDELLKLAFEDVVMERETLELVYADDIAAASDLELSGIQNDYIQKTILSSETTVRLEIIYGRAIKRQRQSQTTIEVPLREVTWRNPLE